MEEIAPSIARYLDTLVPERTGDMAIMEDYAKAHGFPIIGPSAGYFCYLMTRVMGARKVFELGSGYGYSTAWFARGVRENGGGVVHHTVWDSNLSDMARVHLKNMGYEDIVVYHVGEAVETLKNTEDTFDIVFNDIDKSAYPDSLPVIKSKLRRGGLLIVDNILWHGRILDPSERSRDTESIRVMIDMVRNDPEWIYSIVPLRDGLLLAYKQ